MRLFNKVAIVGIGLIGGSLALAIKQKKLANTIVGISRHKETLILAKKMRIIDEGSLDLNIIRDADLIVLAAPVSAIIKLAPEISNIISKKAIVTDVGSTKEEITRQLNRIFPRFVPAHPLAGSERRGAVNANAGLFEKSVCILTPRANVDQKAFKKIKQLWLKTGARVIALDPKTHDIVLSFVSHLPHLLAFSLISTVPNQFLKFAPASLKDATRIAASDGLLWKDIFFSNKKNILKAIGIFEKKLTKIKTTISRDDQRSLLAILNGAKSKRETLR